MEKISTTCSRCVNGVEQIHSIVGGEEVFEEITCRTCGGSALVSHLSLSSDLIDKLNDMHNKINDIFEKL